MVDDEADAKPKGQLINFLFFSPSQFYLTDTNGVRSFLLLLLPSLPYLLLGLLIARVVRPRLISTGTGGGSEEEEGIVLSEPDPTSGMIEPTHNKDGNGHKSHQETLGEPSQLTPIISLSTSYEFFQNFHTFGRELVDP